VFPSATVRVRFALPVWLSGLADVQAGIAGGTPDWLALAAGALGLGLAVAGPRSEAMATAGVVAGVLALALAAPPLVPLVVAGATAFNLVFAFFLAWGLAGGDAPPPGPAAGVGCLGVALAWLAAAAGSRLLVAGAAPLGAPLPLLAALPVVAAAVVVLGARARGWPVRDGLWPLALFLLPPLLTLWMHLVAGRP